MTSELALRGVERIKSMKDLVNYHHCLRESNEELCHSLYGADDKGVENWRRRFCEMRECQVAANAKHDHQQAVDNELEYASCEVALSV